MSGAPPRTDPYAPQYRPRAVQSRRTENGMSPIRRGWVGWLDSAPRRRAGMRGWGTEGAVGATGAERATPPTPVASIAAAATVTATAANCASLTGLHRGKTYCCARKTKENVPSGDASAKVTD